MHISDFIKLTGFLLNTIRYPRPIRPGGFTERSGPVTDTGGSSCDFYVPKKLGGIPVMVLHGITLKGNRDPRLVHFCRSLAACGIPVVAPTMPHLARGTFVPEDISLIEDVARRRSDNDGGPMGIIGFSFGAGYGLLASSRPGMQTMIQYVISFGAYYSMNMLFRSWLEWKESVPASERDLDNRIYTNFIIAYNQKQGIISGAKTMNQLQSLLLRYCDEAGIDEKKAFYDFHIGGKSPALLQDYYNGLDKGILEKLSLAGAIAESRSLISLIHDIGDPVVPYRHSELIYDELIKRRPGGTQSLLCTPIISHVTPGKASLGDTVRLYRSMAPIFSRNQPHCA